MPPCPSANTAGTPVTGVFAPAWVTSQTGPVFSVISMRPSGRKASRQGRLKVATGAMTKGVVGSGACAPRLAWAYAPVDASAMSAAIFTDFKVDPPLGCPTAGRSDVSWRVECER